MTSKFWKYILAFFVLFSGALGLIFVTLLPPKAKNAENHYTQTNNGALSGKNGQVVGVLNNPQLKQDVEENPGLKMVFDSLSSYKAIADKFVVSEDAITQKNTGKEAEENLFPKSYIEGLYKLQDTLVQIGWLNNSEKTRFDTEQEVLAFLVKGVDIFAANNMYPSEQYAKEAKNAAAVVFPKIWKAERSSYKVQRQQYPFFQSKESSQASNKAQAEEMKKNFMQSSYGMFLPNAAQAQSSDGRDNFVTYPDCWKSMTPQNGLGGTNLLAFCCNCGCKYEEYYCRPVPDCGTPYAQNSQCDLFFGCLNDENMGCGPPYLWNAIFDGPPGGQVPATTGYGGTNFQYSMTCGCDNPQRIGQGSP